VSKNRKNISYIKLLEDEKIRQFAESLYFLLQMSLRNKNHKNFGTHKQRVFEFLENNDILEEEINQEILLKFTKIFSKIIKKLENISDKLDSL
jgi:hypothetical protein